MRKLYFILAMMAVATVSCQRDVAYVEVLDEKTLVDEQSSSYAISEEEALLRLQDFLSAIDDGQTRSQNRKIRKIEPLKYESVVTDTRSNQSDIDNLLYIVEFEDNQGSAILGADSRVDDVFAVLESGSISLEDFEGVNPEYDKNELKPFLAKLIVNEAVAQVNEIDFTPKPLFPTDSLLPTTDVYRYVDVRTIYSYVEPMIKTKWGQRAPYNNKCPIVEKDGIASRAPAGCGAIAIAQLIVHHSLTPTLNLNGNVHNYSDVAQFTYENYENVKNNQYLVDCLGNFIFDLAEEMDSEYSFDGTFTSNFDAAQVMRRVGFNNVLTVNLKIDKVKEMIDNAKPIFISGIDDKDTNSDSDDDGHAWVLDGRIAYKKTTYKVTIRDGIEVAREVFYDYYGRDYVHCNFGWYGECDGYYNYEIYDVNDELNEELLEPGDVVESMPNTFDVDLKIIKYNVN